MVDLTFEYQTYTVYETEGELIVCATVVDKNIFCPIDSNQFISISTRSFIAGVKKIYNPVFTHAMLCLLKNLLKIMLPSH